MPSQLKSVVVAVDGSEESMNALKWALSNVTVSSSHDGGFLLILHVQSPPSISVGINPGSIPFGGPSLEVPAFTAAIEAHQKRITDAILQEALNICADSNTVRFRLLPRFAPRLKLFSLGSGTVYKVNVKTHVVVGDPKEKICEVVDNMHADLLVMGNRAFGPIKRMFLGSVSKYCSNHASCPVVIVKPEAGQALPASGDQ